MLIWLFVCYAKHMITNRLHISATYSDRCMAQAMVDAGLATSLGDAFRQCMRVVFAEHGVSVVSAACSTLAARRDSWGPAKPKFAKSKAARDARFAAAIAEYRALLL